MILARYLRPPIQTKLPVGVKRLRNEMMMSHRLKNDITWESSRVRALFDEGMKNRGRGKGPEGGNSFSRALSIAAASLFWAEELL